MNRFKIGRKRAPKAGGKRVKCRKCERKENSKLEWHQE